MPQTLADAALRNRLGSHDRGHVIPRPRGTRLSVVLLTLALVALGRGADAQNLEPRSYINTPVGLNFLLAGYGYAAGGVASDPALPLQNAHLHVHSTLLAYARSLDVWGTSGKIDVAVPYAWLSGSADFEGQPREREVSGFADPRFRFSVNLYGAPALSLQEFASYRQNLIVGASLQAVEGDDLQKNSRLGVTVALPMNRQTSVKLYGSTGVSTHTGSNFNVGGIVLQYRWGGGL